ALTPVPLGLVGRESGLLGVSELQPEVLEGLVALDVERAVLLVVALVLLVHEGVPDEAGLVVEGLAGGVVVGVADLEELVPAGVGTAEQLGHALAVARKARGLEELAVVAQALRSDVGAVADDAAVGIGRLTDLPVEPTVLDVVGAVVAQVGEGVGHL